VGAVIGALGGATVGPGGAGEGGGGGVGITVSMKSANGDAIIGNSILPARGLTSTAATTTAWPAIESGTTDQCRCRRAVVSPLRRTSRKNS
jgi:hypothetical protein